MHKWYCIPYKQLFLTSSFIVTVANGDDGDSWWRRVSYGDGLLPATTCHVASVTAAAMLLAAAAAAGLLCRLTLMPTCKIKGAISRYGSHSLHLWHLYNLQQ